MRTVITKPKSDSFDGTVARETVHHDFQLGDRVMWRSHNKKRVGTVTGYTSECVVIRTDGDDRRHVVGANRVRLQPSDLVIWRDTDRSVFLVRPDMVESYVKAMLFVAELFGASIEQSGSDDSGYVIMVRTNQRQTAHKGTS